MTLRHYLALELDPSLKKTWGLSLTNKFILFIIILSLGTAILETEDTIYLGHELVFFIIDRIVTGLLALEYLLRAWVCVENPKYKRRWRYLVTPSALLDLLTVLLILLTTLGAQGLLLRLSRLLRMLRIAKLGNYSIATKHIREAIFERRNELFISLGMAIIVLIISSASLYFVEGDIQPDKFGSIPRAMWWSAATITTVGYGDVIPVTPFGKFLASLTAIAGIGLIALPAGILASSFSEAMQRTRKKKENENT